MDVDNNCDYASKRDKYTCGWPRLQFRGGDYHGQHMHYHDGNGSCDRSVVFHGRATKRRSVLLQHYDVGAVCVYQGKSSQHLLC